jgi:hypothetical protein
VIHQDSALGKLTGKVVRENIDFNFEMLGASIFDVVIELSKLVQEL